MITYTDDVTGRTMVMTNEELFERIISRHPAKRSICSLQKALDRLYATRQSSEIIDPIQQERAKALLRESLDLDEKYWAFVNEMRNIFFPVEAGGVAPLWDDVDE